MTFDPGSKYHFETIEKNIRSTAETMRISAHSVTLTKALYSRMGEPEYIAFGVDLKAGAIALKVTKEDDPNATVPVRYKSGGVHIKNTAFVRRKAAEITGADLTEKRIVFRRGTKVGDWYVFDAKNAEIVKPSKHDKRGK
jgi:hypothetical protein